MDLLVYMDYNKGFAVIEGILTKTVWGRFYKVSPLVFVVWHRVCIYLNCNH